MTALDFAARGLASQALAHLRTGTFASLAGTPVPAGIDRLQTTGHSEAGKGAAAYVSDALCDAALLAAHPACAFAAADGRIFRLLPEAGAISVEQCGASGDPAQQHAIDDRGAIQAALDYAAAVAIGEIRFEQRHYSVRTPQRTSPADQAGAHDGHPLVVTATVALRSACGDSHLHFRAGDGSPMEEGWQLIKSTAAAPAPDTIWRGGGLFLPGDEALEGLTIDHVHLMGARLRSGDEADPTDHGLWLEGSLPARIVLTGVEIAGFKGDLYHAPAAGPAGHMLSGCHFHTGNGAALRCSGAQGRVTAHDCRFGNARHAARVSDAAGHTYARCRFYGSENLSIAGTGPSILFDSCTVEQVPQCRLGSWTRGTITAIDAPLVIGTADEQQPAHIDLDVRAWLDEAENRVAVTLTGPADLTTQVPGAAPGTFYERPARVRIHVALARRLTESAEPWNAIFALGGLIDKDTVRLSAGECEGVQYLRTDALADLPFIAAPRHFTPSPGGQRDGGSHSAPAAGAAVTLDPLAPAHSFYPAGSGTVDLAIGSAHGHAQGQVLRLWHGGGGPESRIVRLSPGNAGLDLKAPLGLLAGAPLSDPDADRILFWNNAADALAWLELGNGLAISSNVLSANGGGGGSGGWTQIAQSTPRGVSSVAFTGIAQDHADLLLTFEEVSHDNGSNTNMTMAFSHDGATYSAPAGISANAAQSVSWHGAVEIVRYGGNGGIAKAGLGNLAASPSHSAAASNFAWRVNGGISAIRIALGAGQFDAGTLALYAR